MKKRSKILASLVLAGTMVLGLAGCGDSGSANGGTQSGKNSGAKYQVGICQLVQHEALDAATKGFKDALKDKLGDDVSFDEQNAAGDASTCFYMLYNLHQVRHQRLRPYPWKCHSSSSGRFSSHRLYSDSWNIYHRLRYSS